MRCDALQLSSTLMKLGFKTVPHELYCMVKEGIILFFYVDDIVLAYRKAEEEKVMQLMSQLQAHFTITGGEELQWFLGNRYPDYTRSKEAPNMVKSNNLY